MRRVFYDSKRPSSFEERLEFSRDIPYTIRVKRFQTEDCVPLHYARTIEVLLCENIVGKMIIGSGRFDLSGKQLFVIPPNTVHAMTIKAGGGTQYVVKVDFDMMGHYINIPAMFEFEHIDIQSLSFVCPEYDRVRELVQSIIDGEDDIFFCLQQMLSVFYVIKNHRSVAMASETPDVRLRDSNLRKLISWTQENFSRKIRLDEVAAVVGYSKYHFCSNFKAMTGTTYVNYLNSVRIGCACDLLRRGKSITEASFECGFNDVSYFCQLFKKLRGVNPKAFQVSLNKIMTP